MAVARMFKELQQSNKIGCPAQDWEISLDNCPRSQNTYDKLYNPISHQESKNQKHSLTWAPTYRTLKILLVFLQLGLINPPTPYVAKGGLELQILQSLIPRWMLESAGLHPSAGIVLNDGTKS